MSSPDPYLAMPHAQRRALLDEVLAVHGYVCCICGLTISPGSESLQHITPRSKGGTESKDNLKPAHKLCNSQLQDRETTGSAGEIHNGLSWFIKQQ